MNNIIFKKHIINASSELTPTIRISPFTTNRMYSDFSFITRKDLIELRESLRERFYSYSFLDKGRTAISVALDHYNLEKDDIVTILTTSGNYYISSCVTNEIEKKCRWSREITDSTKVIFVNHEFGYAYDDIKDIKKYNLPVIEDCAHTFFTTNSNIGQVGDFIIYSLPKAFPMQLGAILSSRKFDLSGIRECEKLKNYIENHLFVNLKRENEIKQKRLFNYELLKDRLACLDIRPFWENKKGTIPGVFLFHWLNNINYPSLKKFMQANGVESSVFYGQNAFFIPLHDLISEDDIEYMCTLLEFFYNQNIRI